MLDRAAASVAARRRRRSCSARSARPELDSSVARLGAGAARRAGRRSSTPLFPKQPSGAGAAVIDSHTHLDSCEPPDAELVAARARGGRARGSSRSASTAARAARRSPPPSTSRGLRRRRPPPERAEGLRRRRPRRARARWPPTSAASRSARPASTSTATARRAPTRSARSHAQIELARETGKPLVIHTRAAEDETLATLRERAGRRARDPALLLDARPPRRVPRAAALVVLVRRQRHLPERRRARARRPSASPTSACWSRPTRRTSRRRRCARSATSPRSSPTPRASSPSGAASSYEELEARGRAQRRASCSAGERRGRRGAPLPQPSLRRMREFGVRPRRELGQNFLVDSNILGVIERARRARAATTSCSRSAAASACSASTSPSAARTSTSSRSTARSSPRCATRSHRSRTHAALRRRDGARPRRARARRRQGRREPALRDRRRRRSCARSRSCPSVDALGRDGPARGRRAARGGAGHAGLRDPVGARPARLRGRASRGAVSRTRLPPGAERRLRARAARPHADRRPAPELRALVQAAFAHRRKALAALARRSRRAAAAGRARARARAALETLGQPRRRARRAPRRPRSSARSPRALCEREPRCTELAPGEDQPRPDARPAARRRPPRARHA